MHLALLLFSLPKKCLCKRSSVPCQLRLSAFAGAKWALHAADLLFNKKKGVGAIKKKFVPDSHASLRCLFYYHWYCHCAVLRWITCCTTAWTLLHNCNYKQDFFLKRFSHFFSLFICGRSCSFTRPVFQQFHKQNDTVLVYVCIYICMYVRTYVRKYVCMSR